MNENTYQHYPQEYQLFIKKLDNAIRRYQKYPVTIAFDFLKQDYQKVAKEILADQVDYVFIGGYQDALSKRLIITDQEIDEHDYLQCLTATFNPKFGEITHRDVLGALYHQGVEMDQFGDMWVEDGTIYLYCTNQIADYICDSLTTIRHASVTFKHNEEFFAQQFKFKTSQINVSSMRLDVIVGHIIRKSRAKAQEMVKAGEINVNYQTIEDCDFVCDNNNILSIRGYGRFIISDQITITKSGNIVLQIKQYV